MFFALAPFIACTGSMQLPGFPFSYYNPTVTGVFDDDTNFFLSGCWFGGIQCYNVITLEPINTIAGAGAMNDLSNG